MHIFDEIEIHLWHQLARVEFERIGQGLFIKSLNSRALAWISFTGNDYFCSTSIGIVFPHLVKKMYKIQKSVRPELARYRVAAKAGPPLLVLPLTALINQNSLNSDTLEKNSSIRLINKSDADQIFNQVLEIGMNFFEQNAELDQSLKSTIRYCRFGEAQKYLVPLAMYELNFDLDEIFTYIKLCIASYSDNETRMIYENYANNIVNS